MPGGKQSIQGKLGLEPRPTQLCTHLINLALDHGLHRGMLDHLPQDASIPAPNDQHLPSGGRVSQERGMSPTKQAPAELAAGLSAP